MDTPARRLAGELLPALAASPALYPLALDREHCVAQLVTLTRDTYRQATFHDHRDLSADGGTIEWDLSALLAEPPALDLQGPPVHYILHTAFCCSTLLGRAMDSLPTVFCLREPAPLNQVTFWAELERDGVGYDTPWKPSGALEAWLQVVDFLLHRSYPGVHCNVVKTLPQTSLLMPWVLERDARSRVLFLYVDPTTFLCQMLITKRRRLWARRCLNYACANWRSAHTSLSDGEAAALLWVTRMGQYRALRHGRFGARVQALDGGLLATQREQGLRHAITALAIPCDELACMQVVADPLWELHSKGRRRVYDAYNRQEILERTRLRERVEVQRGLRWIADHVDWFAEGQPHFGV